MKKVILLVVSLVFVASLFAGASGEADMSYPIIGYEGSTDDDGGLVQGYVGIGYWGADYGFHFNFNNAAYMEDDWTINHMFKKFTLHKYVNLLVGKTAVPFVKQLNPSASANLNIIEGNCWTFVNPQNEFMIKFDGNIKGLGWQIYRANINAYDDYHGYKYFRGINGLRLDYNLKGADIGVGIQMDKNEYDDWGGFTGNEVDQRLNWAFDFGYTVKDMINLKLQLVNNDDLDDDTDDMNYYTILHYVPGFKGIKPYFGMLTYAEMEENEMFFGANFNPTEDSVLKLEYKMYSEEDYELPDGTVVEDDLNTDTLTLQLGYQF